MDIKWIKNVFNLKRYNDFKSEIISFNYETLVQLSAFVTAISLIFSIFDYIILKDNVFVGVCVFMLILAFIYHFITKKFVNKNIKFTLPVLYSFTCVLLIMSIVVDSVIVPKTSATTYYVCLIILPYFILDKPWRMFITIFPTVIFFVIMTFIFKPKSVAIDDCFNVVTYYMISIILTFYISHIKLKYILMNKNLKKQKDIDYLTGLLNRGAGEKKTKLLLNSSSASALIILDIDNFKYINDNHGHMNGDNMLVEMADLLKSSFNGNDIIYRYGGDEFAIYINSYENLHMIESMINEFREKLSKLSTTTICGYTVTNVTVSFGIALSPQHGKEYELLFEHADKALYSAKQSGKNKYVFFNCEEHCKNK